jgi:hypothetical protein
MMLYMIFRRYQRSILRLCWIFLSIWVATFAAWGQIRTEKAQSADNFVDSIGVNTHLRYLDTSYKNYNTIIKPRLKELGIRHVRDSPIPADLTSQNKFRELGKLGIKLTALVDARWNKTLKEVAEIVGMLPGTVEAIEGPNEWDVVQPTYRGQQFPKALRDFQNKLYSTVKGTATTQHLPVLAASMAHWWNAEKVGLMACDVGNIHSYSGGKMPSAGDLDEWWIPAARLICGKKPIIATETGFHNAIRDPKALHPGVSEQAAGKYIPRLYLEYFNRSIRRTFTYEFIDEELAIDQENNFGLLRYNGSPKPAFTALKNLITLLKDPGSSFSLKSLAYKLTENTPHLHHTLLQKRNGTFYLILWQEVSSFNLKTKQDILAPDLPITINLTTPMVKAAIYRPLKSIKPIQQWRNPKKINLAVPDHLLVVELTPFS